MIQNQIGFDETLEKLDRIIRFMELKLAQWKIEDQLNHEFPDKMWESRKNLARIMIRRGIIKCEHEE